MTSPSRKPAKKGPAAEAKPQAEKKVRGKPFVAGDPRINRTIPGPGRPTDKFKKRCQRIVMRNSSWKAVKRIMRNAEHPAFRAMWNTVAEHGFGKAEAKLEVSGKLTLEQLVAESNKEPKK